MDHNPLLIYQNGWDLRAVKKQSELEDKKIEKDQAYLAGFTFNLTEECDILLGHQNDVDNLMGIEAEKIVTCKFILPYQRGDVIERLSCSSSISTEIGKDLKKWCDNVDKEPIYLELVNQESNRYVALNILGKVNKSIRIGRSPEKKTTIMDHDSVKQRKWQIILRVFMYGLVLGVVSGSIGCILMKQVYNQDIC